MDSVTFRRMQAEVNDVVARYVRMNAARLESEEGQRQQQRQQAVPVPLPPPPPPPPAPVPLAGPSHTGQQQYYYPSPTYVYLSPSKDPWNTAAPTYGATRQPPQAAPRPATSTPATTQSQNSSLNLTDYLDNSSPAGNVSSTFLELFGGPSPSPAQPGSKRQPPSQ